MADKKDTKPAANPVLDAYVKGASPQQIADDNGLEIGEVLAIIDTDN